MTWGHGGLEGFDWKRFHHGWATEIRWAVIQQKCMPVLLNKTANFHVSFAGDVFGWFFSGVFEAVWGLKYPPKKIRKNLWRNTFSKFDNELPRFIGKFLSDSLICHIWSVEPIEPCFDSFLWNFPLDLLSRSQWKQGSHSTIFFLFLLSNGAKKHRDFFSKMDLLLWCFHWPSFAPENDYDFRLGLKNVDIPIWSISSHPRCPLYAAVARPKLCSLSFHLAAAAFLFESLIQDRSQKNYRFVSFFCHWVIKIWQNIIYVFSNTCYCD